MTELFRRLRDEAEIALGESPTERRAREEDDESNRRLRLGATACEALLGGLDPREGCVGMSGARDSRLHGPARRLAMPTSGVVVMANVGISEALGESR